MNGTVKSLIVPDLLSTCGCVPVVAGQNTLFIILTRKGEIIFAAYWPPKIKKWGKSAWNFEKLLYYKFCSVCMTISASDERDCKSLIVPD